MALTAKALTTRARFKTFAGITANDASTNTICDNVINTSSEWIENYCRRIFGRSTYTNQLYDGNDDNRLLLKYYPVISTSTFTLAYRNSGINEDDWSTVDSEYYFVDYDSGIVSYPKAAFGSRGQIFARGSANYRVTYTAGYYLPQDALWTEGATTALPTDIEYACWKLSKKCFDERQEGDAVDSEKLGQYAITYSKAAFEDTALMGILDRHARQDISYFI